MNMIYRNFDNSKLPQAVRIEWSRVVTDDHGNYDRPDENDDGFWPSQDPKAAGYVGDVSQDEFERMHDEAKARMRAWEAGEWNYVGVQARATIFVPIGGNSFSTYELLSPGLWSIESDSGEEYLNSVFEDEKASLLADLRKIGEAIAAL
jgi:hypothetical protein